MTGRAALGCALALWAGAARAGADAPLGRPAGGTFGSLFLEVTGADARALPSTELEVAWTLANDWSAAAPFRSAGRRIWLQADEQSDALSARLRLPWSRLLGPGEAWRRLSTALEARLVEHWGGWTDRPIEGWHRLVASTNFMRARFPRDAVSVLAFDLDGGRGLRLRGARLALGDLAVRTQWLLAEGGQAGEPGRAAWGLSARLDVKVPLGAPERLGGSGGWDAGAALLATVELVPGITFHALAGACRQAPLPASLPLAVQPLRPAAELSLAMRVGAWTVLLEDRVSGPLLRRLAPLPEVPPEQVEASAYYGLALTQNRVLFGLRRGPLTFWLSEDWTPGVAPRAAGLGNWFNNSNAPDVALGLSWSGPLGE